MTLTIEELTGRVEALEYKLSKLQNCLTDQPKKPSKRLAKPELEEVIQYMSERNSPDPVIQANGFIDHYTSNGWKVGKNPMKDWKSAVRNWLKPKAFNVAPTNKKSARVRLTSRESLLDTSW